MTRFLSIAAGIVAAAISSSPVLAHPHIFIDARMIVAFNAEGEVTSITHAWLFDEAFSAWETQGRDADGDGTLSKTELHAYAVETVTRLAALRFYTESGEGVANLPLASMDDARMTMENGRLLLVFGLEPQSPFRITESLEIAVHDPEYYTAFNLTGGGTVILGNAPDGCTGAYQPPKPLPPELEAQLYSLPPDLTALPPELAAALRGREGAVVVSCEAQP